MHIAMSPDDAIQGSSLPPRSLASDLQALRQSPIFRMLGDADLTSVLEAAHVRTYWRGQIIVRAHDRVEFCYLVASGAARAYRLSTTGQEIALERLQQGDVYGLVMLDLEREWKCSLEATTNDTTVYRIPIASVEKVCASRPVVALAALRLLSRRLKDARDRIEDLALYDVKTRVAHTLARLAGGNAERVVRQTHRELAWTVGTRQEEVTRMLRYLRQEGLISYEPKREGIIILDIEALAAYEGRTS